MWSFRSTRLFHDNEGFDACDISLFQDTAVGSSVVPFDAEVGGGGNADIHRVGIIMTLYTFILVLVKPDVPE